MDTLRIILFVGVLHISGIFGDAISKCNQNPEKDGEYCRIFKKRFGVVAKYVSCVPKGIDDKCQGMTAILKGSPRTVRGPLECNRRRKCPPGSDCIQGQCCYRGPTQQDVVCCSAPQKPGSCPRIPPIDFNLDCSRVLVYQACKRDEDCKKDLKCCLLNNCGGTDCLMPVKPVGCPEFVPIGIDCSLVRVARNCETCEDCEGNQNCCLVNECGGTSCLEPVKPAISCPKIPLITIICSLGKVAHDCKSDVHCERNQRCCTLNECGATGCLGP